jgi:hypothetical protein
MWPAGAVVTYAQAVDSILYLYLKAGPGHRAGTTHPRANRGPPVPGWVSIDLARQWTAMRA